MILLLCHKSQSRLVDLIRKNISACLFSVHKYKRLSYYEQVCLMRLRFERYFYVNDNVPHRKYTDLCGNNRTCGLGEKTLCNTTNLTN